MRHYPKSFVQRLREAATVSEIIGKHVPLKRKGREWEACCPFHQEKTPSFFVNDQKGFYHCFGCAAHGDSLKFLMEYEKLSYPEAIEALAQELAIPLPEFSPEQQQQEQQQQNLQQVMALAAEWFGQQLHGDAGMAARSYLQQRGVTPDIVASFHLGYAPADRSGLISYLQSQNVTPQQLQAVGLSVQPDTGMPYSRFRSRVMFPITNSSGDVIAFGGRLLEKHDRAPKYLNSPETELFHKSYVLYNWQSARRTITDQSPILVVEGYMDVIALHQAGFPQGVAPLGTALTETHLRKIWQACDAPVLCLDGDNAGQRAMWRSAELALSLLQPGKTLRFCTLPPGQDPDDFLKQQGSDAFRRLVAKAQPLSQIVWQHLRTEHGTETPEQRAALEAKLEALAETITHANLQQHFRRFFRDKLWERKGKPRTTVNSRVKQLASTDGRRTGQMQLERQLLRALLCKPDLLDNAMVEESLGMLDPIDPGAKESLDWLLAEQAALPPQHEWPEQVQQLREDKSVHLPDIFRQSEAAPHLLEAHWQQMLNALQLLTMQTELQQLQQELAADMSEARLLQFQALQKEIEALKTAQSLQYAEG